MRVRVDHAGDVPSDVSIVVVCVNWGRGTGAGPQLQCYDNVEVIVSRKRKANDNATPAGEPILAGQLYEGTRHRILQRDRFSSTP